MTIGELKELIKDVPDETKILVLSGSCEQCSFEQSGEIARTEVGDLFVITVE